jgi:hypothetical protein
VGQYHENCENGELFHPALRRMSVSGRRDFSGGFLESSGGGFSSFFSVPPCIPIIMK